MSKNKQGPGCLVSTTARWAGEGARTAWRIVRGRSSFVGRVFKFRDVLCVHTLARCSLVATCDAMIFFPRSIRSGNLNLLSRFERRTTEFQHPGFCQVISRLGVTGLSELADMAKQFPLEFLWVGAAVQW